MSERIAKALARAGLCSRREAERWIEAGRVVVDGTVLTSPARDVDDGNVIEVDGKPLPERDMTRLFRYHKPAGLVTTHKDEQGRPTVFEKLPAGLPRLISVGRLDLNSEGLLLLTNDGGLARELELPSRGWIRRYRVRVHGTVTPAQLAPLAKGVTVEGVAYGPIEATLDRVQGANAWVDDGPARRPQPRNPQGDGEPRPRRDAADPSRVWPFPARRSAARRGRRGAARHYARAARPRTGAAPCASSPAGIEAARSRRPKGALRPTSSRAREALFDILAHGRFAERELIEGALVLDAFAGTGALGLEALSRGAAHATFMERDRHARALLGENIKMLDEEKSANLMAADALHPPRAAAPCDLVFLDPPYGENVAAEALTALAGQGWFAAAA